MTRLLLARHGETDWNRERRFQGQLDVPLNATGHEQARQLAERLAREPFQVIYTSDLRRAYDSAALVSGGHVTICADERLREMHYGAFQGLTHVEMEALHPNIYAAWQPTRRQVPPGGETVTQFAARIDSFLHDMAARFDDDHTVLVLSHGEVLQMLICLALDFPAARYWQFSVPNNGALSELCFQDGISRLIRLNDGGAASE